MNAEATRSPEPRAAALLRRALVRDKHACMPLRLLHNERFNRSRIAPARRLPNGTCLVALLSPRPWRCSSA